VGPKLRLEPHFLRSTEGAKATGKRRRASLEPPTTTMASGSSTQRETPLLQISLICGAWLWGLGTSMHRPCGASLRALGGPHAS
jgi:hypothetical protein